jgi:hypothetical protein
VPNHSDVHRMSQRKWNSVKQPVGARVIAMVSIFWSKKKSQIKLIFLAQQDSAMIDHPRTARDGFKKCAAWVGPWHYVDTTQDFHSLVGMQPQRSSTPGIWNSMRESDSSLRNAIRRGCSCVAVKMVFFRLHDHS